MAWILREDGKVPPWSELRGYHIVDLAADEVAELRREAPRLRLLVAAGTVQAAFDGGTQVLKENQFLDLPAGAGACTLRGGSDRAQCVVLSGDWGDELGGCGLFRVRNEPAPSDGGDPVNYPKRTAVDRHYHDCDEYWILLEGHARVALGAQQAEMRPGDCLAIGTGHHHDMPEAMEPVKAVFFETTLRGRKRIGHLWEHTHGPAKPLEERA